METSNKTNWVVLSIIWVVLFALAGIFVVKTLNGESIVNMFSEPYQSIKKSTINVIEIDTLKQDSTNTSQTVSVTVQKYYGNVGNLDAEFTLTWKGDGNIDGTYFYPTRKDVTYTLKGKDNGNGSIALDEYTAGKLSANCTLQSKGDCYEGTMNNTNGKKFTMKFCKTQVTQSASSSQLIIQGTKVNVRTSPSKQAAVILQLNTGDVCTMLEKGNIEEIGGVKSNWYKINFNGKIGWVFGAFTNLK